MELRRNPPAERRLGAVARTRSKTEARKREKGETFQPENDWIMADRQAEDRAGSEENAAKRQRRDWAAQEKNYQCDYPDQAIVIRTTRRWAGNQSTKEEKNKRQSTPNTSDDDSQKQKRTSRRTAKTQEKNRPKPTKERRRRSARTTSPRTTS